jgi:outer membrane protein
MKIKTIGIAIFLIGLIGGSIFYLIKKSENHIYYVRNQYLVENFQGMKDAEIDFNERFKREKNFLDSLQLMYKTMGMTYNSPGLEAEQKKNLEKNLSMLQNQLTQYSQYYKNITDEADKKMTDQVLNQVNAYVKEYGEKKGCDIIIGTTTSGNILYGKKELDITDDLLKEIDEMYKGKK